MTIQVMLLDNTESLASANKGAAALCLIYKALNRRRATLACGVTLVGMGCLALYFELRGTTAHHFTI